MASTNDTHTDQRTKAEVRTGTEQLEGKRSQHRKEVEEILQNAARPTAEQLVMNLKATITKEDIANLPPPNDRQNPVLAHKLYYLTLGRLRRRYLIHNKQRILPQGARAAFNLEIRTFLKNGERNVDSRMATTKRLAGAVNIFVKWTDNYSEGDLTPLFQMFCDENDKLRASIKETKKK